MENITSINTMKDDNCTREYSDLYHKLNICRIVIYSMVCFLGTTGNGLVIWFGIFRMKKTVNIMWFLNLAVADFSFTLFLPMNITQFVIHHWPFGPLMCDFYWFLFFLNISVSILQLMVISLDRFLCVFCPVWCHNHRKPRLALMVALFIWIISIVFILPHFFVNVKSEKHKSLCYGHRTIYKNTWVGIIRLIFFFLLPFLIILSCYVAIVLRMRGKRMAPSSRPYKIILSIIIAFFISWFPYNLSILLKIFGAGKIAMKVIPIVKVISENLMFFNSCINPILYVLIGRDFKETLCSSFQAMFEKAFTEGMERTVSKKPKGSTGDLELSHINALKNIDVI
ncbi:chemerin-like receptor 1 [Dendropsophus ebraccatus]|uniref:chemerin-like receptor 1 n=1 Tax=Dendropsophus ebraccatus TaxID=150705 RepID=UPI0038321A0A